MYTFSQKIRRAFAILLEGTEVQEELPKEVVINNKEDANNYIFQYHGKLPHTIINMSDASGLFADNQVLLSIESLDTKRIRNTSKMFSNCTNLYQISNKDIKSIDFSKVKYMDYMFEGTKGLSNIQDLVTDSCISMAGMFAKSNIRRIPKMNTSKVTSMEGMFSSCRNIMTIPQLDTSKVKNFNYFLARCENLKYLPELNTISAVTMIQMFTHCSSLQTIPMMNTKNVENMSKMFRECNSLRSLPELNTSKVKDMTLMCYKCPNLGFVHKMDLSSNPQMDKMFDGCMNREELACMRDGKLYLGNKMSDKKKRLHVKNPSEKVGPYDKINKERLSGKYYD